MNIHESGISHEELVGEFKAMRGDLPDGLQLRIHRGLSWLERAEQEIEDDDAAFIFYWIAFNALYAEDRPEVTEMSERSVFQGYFNKVAELDSERAIYDALWNRFTQEIRIFLDNQYVFEPFWKHHNGVTGFGNWASRFERSKRAAGQALFGEDTPAVLSILFDRLYVLRNQLIHGGATWGGRVNRTQVRDGRRIVAFLVPLFVRIMTSNPQEPWGAPFYPPVDQDPH